MKKPEAELARAQYEALQAKKRMMSSVGALQYRLKPATIANQAWEGVRGKTNHAWEGVRGKSSGLAEDALQVVKERPGAASGVLAAIVIFLARHPLLRAASAIVGRGHQEDEGVIKADLENHDEKYDLTAPTVDPRAQRSAYEGVSA
jgi:hypothetical protein